MKVIILITPSLVNWQRKKDCKVLADDKHIKPESCYQGNNGIGYSHDEPSKSSWTVLFIIIATVMRAPAFVRWLIPVLSLKYDLLFDQTLKVINLIYKNNGFALLINEWRLKGRSSMLQNVPGKLW